MRGISTSSRCKSPDCLAVSEIGFAIRYYSEKTILRDKVMSSYEGRALAASGLRLGAVYQDRAQKPVDFSQEAGRRHGAWARRYAWALHQPPGSAIFFAVDFDASLAVVDGEVAAYFGGVREALGDPAAGDAYRIGVYGSGLVCRRIVDELGLADVAWLAMSTGWHESAAYDRWTIRQSGPTDTLCDLEHDYEHCETRDGGDLSWSFVPDPALPGLDEDSLPLLVEGEDSADVVFLQQLLNGWLDEEAADRLKSDGDFGARTRKAVKAFQAGHTDRFGGPLAVDGKVGGRTWGSLLRYSAGQDAPVAADLDALASVMPPETAGGSVRGRAALAKAVAELTAGAREIGGDNRGPFVEKYVRPILDPFQPVAWCAAFASWCFRESGAMPFDYTLGARDLMGQLREDETFWTDPEARRPEPGDLVFWWRDHPASWKGHVGFVHQVREGDLITIEGNKGGRVRACRYAVVGAERLLGFARVG